MSASATALSGFANNTTIPGFYAQAMLDGSPYPSSGAVPYTGNDGGQHPEAFYYSFGTAGSTERALGGIATTFYNNSNKPMAGTGYVAMRVVNQTGRPIANLEVSYAMEQWYNSGKVDKAQVGFDYQVLASGTFGGMMEAGTWTSVPALSLNAPSTATVIASKNGNAPANRRVLNATLTGINLAVNQEIVLRWKYVLNTETNGNGLSVDDVSITPEAGALVTGTGTQANIFYYAGTGDLKDSRNWLSPSARTNPASFTADNQIFYIATPGQFRLDRNLVSGTNSKLIIGDGTTSSQVAVAIQSQAGDPSTTIDVGSNGLLEIDGEAGTLPRLGKLNPTSTVYFNTKRTNILLSCSAFGNLRLATNTASLACNLTVAGSLSLSKGSLVQLGTYDLTVLKGGAVSTDGTAYVVTNAGGALRQTVSPSQPAVLFPVGQATYNPAWLSQAATGVEDVFGVSLSDSVYVSYVTVPTLPAGGDKGEGRDKKGTGAVAKNSTTLVNHTWYISEADLGHSNVTVTLQGALPTGMTPAQVAVGHYHNGVWESDAKQRGAAAVVDPTSNLYRFTRAGVTDFSPFGLYASAPLPVELLAFTAKRTATAVTCAWATASELDNDHFVLERSLDGQSFRALASVAGAGNSLSRHEYNWVDNQPASTLAYYRLRQVDRSGTEAFSPVVAVGGTATGLVLQAYPNPSLGTLALTIGTPTATTVRGSLTTVLGAEVLHFTQAVAEGTQALPLDLSALPASVYLLRVETPQSVQTLRIVKQ
ncbi:T9SS type A sorting domain-containing protein [Hymenobacter ginkgonis]|uniref:T9SS type A sorting domain-containing protein n=1 Tax=Hymenobacter ginkgonis TaxID=2682976 RepID=UPI0018DE41B0|nr:T9SS type A sorting domain-containing protein [Hymenobacter ginkgonis]